MPPDPKPQPRYRAPKGEWNAIVRALITLHGECECGCGRRAESGHHFVARGDGGDDVRENCLVLAGSGTTLCHGAAEGNVVVTDGEKILPAEVKAALRERIETARLDVREYAVQRKGVAWLDRRYPRES